MVKDLKVAWPGPFVSSYNSCGALVIEYYASKGMHDLSDGYIQPSAY